CREVSQRERESLCCDRSTGLHYSTVLKHFLIDLFNGLCRYYSFRRWGFGIDEVLKDPVGREQFLKFLESEFSSENLRFWLAVQELKRRPIREVPTRVQEIWEEFLAPGAPSAINVDSKSYDKTTQNVKDPGRYAFEDAQLMKSDSYSRFIRSSAYQELLQAKKKVKHLGSNLTYSHNQYRVTHLEYIKNALIQIYYCSKVWGR
uniref:Regulator of G protein signaling 7a n=1 Tax=Sinocyclocheilus grahami TaxID=75366 RepID=A0A672QJV2_SINGR